MLNSGNACMWAVIVFTSIATAEPVAWYDLGGDTPLSDRSDAPANLSAVGDVKLNAGAAEFKGRGCLQAKAEKFQPSARAWTVWARFRYRKGKQAMMAVVDHSGSNRRGWYLRVYGDGDRAGAVEGGLGLLEKSSGKVSKLAVITDAGTLKPNTWHEVAFACDPESTEFHVRMYVDGEIAKSFTLPGLVAPSNTYAPSKHALRLGQIGNGKAYRFVGEIDEVQLFDAGLTAEQVQAIKPVTTSSNAHTHTATGQVVAINADAGRLTLKHFARRDGRFRPVRDQFVCDGQTQINGISDLGAVSIGDYVTLVYAAGSNDKFRLIQLTPSEVGAKDEEG